MKITHDDFAIILACISITLSTLAVIISLLTEQTLKKIEKLRHANRNP